MMASASNEEEAAPSLAPAEDASQSTPSSTATGTPFLFPCLEQPLRVVLHSTAGYYLWAGRKGQVIARGRRSEKDEWRIERCHGEEGVVRVHNHKFGGLLAVVSSEDDGSSHAPVASRKNTVVCVKKKDNDGHQGDLQLQLQPDNAEDRDEGDSTGVTPSNLDTDNIHPQAGQWCFIKSAAGNGNQLMLQSLQTGEFLAIGSKGQVLLTLDASLDGSNSNNHHDTATATTTTTTTTTWHVECVTGELCFLSNLALNSRLRCDMAGLTSLTDQWKGWEVFRIMESSHHYVKISSWMHSQWILSSTADGTVSTCTLADAMKLDQDETASGKCSKWAIERHPNGNGVIIRSQRHGRLLSVKQGVLRTYSDNDPPEETLELAQQQQQQQPQGDAVEASNRKSWSSVRESMTGSMRTMQQRWSSVRTSSSTTSTVDDPPPTVLQKDTTVWQLEAAHLQTYYFGSIVMGEKPMTIGQFPQVTTNLRKTDKLRLLRRNEPVDGDLTRTITKLYHVDKDQYVACCSPEGLVALVTDVDAGIDESLCTDWIMEKQPNVQDGGSVFRSTKYNLYLSYQEDDKAATVGADDDDNKTDSDNNVTANKHHWNTVLRNQPEKVGTLVCTAEPPEDIRHGWRLEPCMPRAVSSEKIATFAIGTSIAVGTTIAMPFALAGVAGVMGLVGLEAGIAFNVIAAGLTGAEFLASVGAIGATAYLVFRPAQNSLTDDHDKDEEEGEREWSKRPFSNWRNW